MKSEDIQKGRFGLEKEQADPLKASTVTFKFICFKTPWNGLGRVPRKFYFHFKFFTFPAVKTATVQIKNPNEHATSGDDAGLKAGQPYYLGRVTPGNPSTLRKEDDTSHDPNLLAVTFSIDPSMSRVPEEHGRLAEYLYDRFLTVDVFDAESLFLYGTCKVPLFELLRQGAGSVVRAKECEMCDPESGDFRGAVQLIMTNVGSTPSVSFSDTAKAGGPRKVQPS